MKTSTIVCLALSTNFLVSCGYKKKAKEVTQDFFSVTKNDKEKMVELIVSVNRYHRSARIGTIIAEEPVPL